MLKGRTQTSALAALAARMTLLTAGFARLFKDDGFIPDETSLIADCAAHEADYTGYVAGGVALATPVGPWQDGPNLYSDQFATIQFQPTGPVLVSNEIRGVFFEDSGGDLDEFWVFDEPVTMASVLDAILVIPRFSESTATTTADDPES